MITESSELHKDCLGKYAIFRKDKESKHTRFCVLHDTYESALDEVSRLIAIAVNRDKDKDRLFFIVELKDFFAYTDGVFSSSVD